MAERKTILVVEDEAKIAEIIRSYLEKNGYETVCAIDGLNALTLFEQTAPALVILDLMLPKLSGEEVCKAIRRKSRVPVIMLTAKSAEENILEGLGIGADDYVVKPFSPRQLMARVEAVLRRAEGGTMPVTNVLEFAGGTLVIDGVRREVTRQGERFTLTPTEFNLLFAMAKHPNKIFTREELIALALGDSFEGFDRVIDTHIKNIRQKIHSGIIKTVHGVGYAFGGE